VFQFALRHIKSRKRAFFLSRTMGGEHSGRLQAAGKPLASSAQITVWLRCTEFLDSLVTDGWSVRACECACVQ
jgi:hypothetical protein